MITHQEIATYLETLAPLAYQESYDNCGLLVGNRKSECTGLLATLDVTELVIQEAVQKKCNLIVAHHPLIFSGLKKIVDKNMVDKCVAAAIKNDVAIYALHTNLDNVLHGVNTTIANKLQLVNEKILVPKKNILKKLIVFVPTAHQEKVRTALFRAGAQSFVGKQDCEEAIRIEAIFATPYESTIVNALHASHPYETPVYDIITLNNEHTNVGSGLIGELLTPCDEILFLQRLQHVFNLKIIRHTALRKQAIRKVAVCGGAGSAFIMDAIAANADIYITADVKYHEFFNANNQLVIADIGHWESEQFVPNLIVNILQTKFPTFAVLESKVVTNPVQVFV